jgi:hypothetical protein
VKVKIQMLKVHLPTNGVSGNFGVELAENLTFEELPIVRVLVSAHEIICL